jgi:hypothetical protein
LFRRWSPLLRVGDLGVLLLRVHLTVSTAAARERA